VISLLFSALVLLAQATDEVEAARLRAEHGRCVASERTAIFVAAWVRLDEPARRQLEERVNGARPRGAPPAALPPLRELISVYGATGASAVGPVPLPRLSEQRALQAFADSLDLAVQPAAFEARADGLGEAVTVHVSTLLRPRIQGECYVALTWIGPEGQRVAARREPASVSALGAGVPMFLRPPTSEPGIWTLGVHVEKDELAARGPGTPVECVAELGQRAARALVEAPEQSVGDARLRRLLRLSLEQGVRSSVSLSPARALALLEGGGDASWPRPAERAFVEPLGHEGWIWSRHPGGELARTIVLVAPGTELPDAVFYGALGEEWLQLAVAEDALLLAVDLPTAVADRTVVQVFERARARARELGVPEAGELVAVARGDVARRLSLALPAGAVDAAVLSTMLPGDDPSVFMRGVPRLIVAPGGAAELPSELDPDEPAWVDGSPTPLFNEARLPALVGAWLGARGGAR
jgi:hypothetical protein